MLSKALCSLALLGLVTSFSAMGEEVVPPSPKAAGPAESAQISITIGVRADEVKEVKVISDDKKSATVYAVEGVDERLVDGTLLKNPDSDDTKKIREEIKAKIIASGQPVETYKLKKGDYEKLQSESQWFWNRWARRAYRWGYGGYGYGYGYGRGYGYGYGGYYGGYYNPYCYTYPTYYVQPVYYAAPVVYDYGFYGCGGGYGVFIG